MYLVEVINFEREKMGARSGQISQLSSNVGISFDVFGVDQVSDSGFDLGRLGFEVLDGCHDLGLEVVDHHGFVRLHLLNNMRINLLIPLSHNPIHQLLIPLRRCLITTHFFLILRWHHRDPNISVLKSHVKRDFFFIAQGRFFDFLVQHFYLWVAEHEHTGSEVELRHPTLLRQLLHRPTILLIKIIQQRRLKHIADNLIRLLAELGRDFHLPKMQQPFQSPTRMLHTVESFKRFCALLQLPR